MGLKISYMDSLDRYLPNMDLEQVTNLKKKEKIKGYVALALTIPLTIAGFAAGIASSQYVSGEYSGFLFFRDMAVGGIVGFISPMAYSVCKGYNILRANRRIKDLESKVQETTSG